MKKLMLHQFRHLYPQGSLMSELIEIDRGLYIVKVSVENQKIVLGTGLAAAETVEQAEDKARERALMTLNLTQAAINQDTQVKSPQNIAQASVNSEIPSHNHYSEVKVAPPSIKLNKDVVPAPQPVPAVPPEPIPEPQIEDVLPLSQPEEDYETETTPTNIFDQPLTEPPEEDAPPETTDNVIEFDFNEIKHKIDLEMKRLNWTREQGRDYLLSTYGKRSRLHLTDPELLEFLQYLENLAN